MGARMIDDQMILDYLDGISVIDIAKNNKLTREAVYLHLRTLPDWENRKGENLRRRKRKTFNEHEKSLPKIIKLREKGYSTSRVSKKLHIPLRTVQKLLRGTVYDNTISARRRRDKEIYKKYQKGMSEHNLAKMYNLSQSGISNIVRKWHSKKTS